VDPFDEHMSSLGIDMTDIWSKSFESARQLMVDKALYGAAFIGVAGERIDPVSVLPREHKQAAIFYRS
jgi:hypothetical protein